jgi:hypothetical protein
MEPGNYVKFPLLIGHHRELYYMIYLGYMWGTQMPSDITAHEKNNTIVSDASEARIEALQNLSNLLET